VERHVRIGIDLGGTKIETVAMLGDGSELGRFRLETPAGDYDGIIAAVAASVRRAEDAWGPTGRIGLGTPGAIDPTTGLLKNSNSVVLNGKPLQQDVEAALGRAVRMANDADCFALSEAADGAAAGAGSVFGVIIGTGVGGGLVYRGALVAGPNAIAGEWGHNPLPWPEADERPGALCYCGLSGCIETFLSGPGFERDHRSSTGVDLAAADIAAAAAAGDPRAGASLERYGHRMARALAAVINVFDPEVIVLGGGLSNIDALYEAVPRRWGEYVFSPRVLTKLVRAGHGDSSGVRGAARLWPAAEPA
jgi:fructokinase